MATGTVKWFNSAKGYGFIEPEDGSKDAFVHISAVERAGLSGLTDGQKVEFELVSGRDGKMGRRKSGGVRLIRLRGGLRPSRLWPAHWRIVNILPDLYGL